MCFRKPQHMQRDRGNIVHAPTRATSGTATAITSSGVTLASVAATSPAFTPSAPLAPTASAVNAGGLRGDPQASVAPAATAIWPATCVRRARCVVHCRPGRYHQGRGRHPRQAHRCAAHPSERARPLRRRTGAELLSHRTAAIAFRTSRAVRQHTRRRYRTLQRVRPHSLRWMRRGWWRRRGRSVGERGLRDARGQPAAV